MANALGVRFNATSTGTGDFVDASLVTGYRRGSGVLVDGSTYRYRAENQTLSEYEWGTGIWTSSTSTLARTTIFASSTGSKVSFSSVPQVAIVIFPADVREILAAATTFYVRADGNDSNSGLANTAAGAFLTFQGCYDRLANRYDFGGQTVTIFNGSGAVTYTAPLSISAAWSGGGNLVFDGNGCTINTASPSIFNIGVTVPLPGVFTVQNVTLTSSTSATLISHGGTGQLSVGSGVTIGTSVGGDHVAASANAMILFLGNYTITGGARIHVYARTGGIISMYAGFGFTTTIAANITFSDSFANVDPAGTVFAVAAARTISLGAFTVTGKRYTSTAGGVVYTNGGGANYFPGTVAGSGAGVYG
jgi:hypothetical protein